MLFARKLIKFQLQVSRALSKHITAPDLHYYYVLNVLIRAIRLLYAVTMTTHASSKEDLGANPRWVISYREISSYSLQHWTTVDATDLATPVKRRRPRLRY